MSPEQARGKAVDKRTDVWAFGCVLYEMLGGRRPFDGEDATEMVAAVVKTTPDWSVLPPDLPPALVSLIQHCLEKDRKTRVGDIAAAMFVLSDQATLNAGTAAAPSLSRLAPPHPVPRWRRTFPIVAGAVLGAVVAFAIAWRLDTAGVPRVIRTVLPTSASTALVRSGTGRYIAITPDGSRVVYARNNQLLVRALDQLEPLVLSGLGAPRDPFISPDGHTVGFFEGLSRLGKVAITGGPPVIISAVDGGGPRGATWGPDGTIIFATNVTATGLQRVSAAGGDPVVLTKPDREHGEADHVWPEFLPGGEAVLFTIIPAATGSLENAQIAVLDLRTKASKVLIRAGATRTMFQQGTSYTASTGPCARWDSIFKRWK